MSTSRGDTVSVETSWDSWSEPHTRAGTAAPLPLQSRFTAPRSVLGQSWEAAGCGRAASQATSSLAGIGLAT
jgi:hypothetical protein